MRAEALKWENKRLAEAKAKLEAQLRDQSRRMAQLEDTLAEIKGCTSSKRSAPSRGLHSSFKVPQLASPPLHRQSGSCQAQDLASVP